MNIMTLAGIQGNIYHMDSLAFPRGHLSGVTQAGRAIQLGTVDIVDDQSAVRRRHPDYRS